MCGYRPTTSHVVGVCFVWPSFVSKGQQVTKDPVSATRHKARMSGGSAQSGGSTSNPAAATDGGSPVRRILTTTKVDARGAVVGVWSSDASRPRVPEAIGYRSLRGGHWARFAGVGTSS